MLFHIFLFSTFTNVLNPYKIRKEKISGELVLRTNKKVSLFRVHSFVFKTDELLSSGYYMKSLLVIHV